MTVSLAGAGTGSFGTSPTDSVTYTGTAYGVLAMIHQMNSGSDLVSACTGDGVSMTEVALSPHTFNNNIGVGYGYFVGSGLGSASSPMAVAVTSSAGVNVVGYVLSGAGQDTAVADTSTTVGFGTDATGTLSLGGETSFCAHVVGNGNIDLTDITDPSGWTADDTDDWGSNVAKTHSYDTIASSDVTFGATVTNGHFGCLGVAVYETAGGGGGISIPVVMHHRRMMN